MAEKIYINGLSTPQIRDIHIGNIVCDGAEESIFVCELREVNIRDILWK
jgi:hypothetical protein